MKTKFTLEVEGLTSRNAGHFVLKDVSFKMKDGECWAITGPSGSGKTTLLKSIQHYRSFPGKISFGEKESPNIVFIGHHYAFRNHSGLNNFYYQQRFNATESDEVQTVMEDMLSLGGERHEAISALRLLQVDHLKNSPLLHLSTGENKRYQIAKGIFKKADWLLLDNPFTGLDKNAVGILEAVLQNILNKGTKLVLVTDTVVPGFITQVAELQNGVLTGVYDRYEFDSLQRHPIRLTATRFQLPESLKNQSPHNFEVAVQMKDVRIAYGDRVLLNGINWEVRRGDKWSLSGPNGSGKSTLLSLITADNPQAFANDIVLFDRKRGSGETIWDIKEKIGFVSTELHRHFDKSATCFQAVASGLFDSIGLFRKLSETNRKKVEDCLKAFQLDSFSQMALASLPFGTQRLILLARAVIKDPPLLILDEPCQGLDAGTRTPFLQLLENLCVGDRTLIYVTHVDEEIPACIDRYLKLENGKIKETEEYEKDHYGDSRRRHRA